MSKHYETHLVHRYSLIKDFPMTPRAARQEVLWFGRSECDKQNKLTSQLHR
jgi:hypothetical protein